LITKSLEVPSKKDIYGKLGVLYYIIYNPEFWRRDGHQPLEVYKLVDGEYQLQIGEPFWMPEVGLGIGRCPEIFPGSTEEVLSWFDERGDRHLRPEEKEIRAEQRADNEANRANIEAAARTAAEQSAAIEANRADLLAAKLRELGIDPDTL
jgi:Putative restriction endonuclease